MRRLLLLAFTLVLGSLLTLPAGAQNYLWFVVNGIPYAPQLGFSGGSVLDGTTANVIEQRNGTNAQILRLSNTFTDADNYERLRLRWTGNVASIATEAAGTGTTRTLQVGTSGSSVLSLFTNDTIRWNIGATTGAFSPDSDDTYDIGVSGTARPNDVFLAGRFSVNNRATVTVDAATTFAVASSYTLLACTGAETINTITGGLTGSVLWLEHTDTECTIADDDDATASNAVDLTGTATNDIGAVNKMIGLIYNGTYWMQTNESDN